jgi:hypothetical protein
VRNGIFVAMAAIRGPRYHSRGDTSKGEEALKSPVASFVALAVRCALVVTVLLPSLAFCAAARMAVAADAPPTPEILLNTGSALVFDFGRNTTISGTVTGESVASGHSVLLQYTPDSGASWVTTATTSTDDGGHFAFAIAPMQTTTYQAVLAENPGITTDWIEVAPRIPLSKISGASRGRRSIRWLGQVKAVVVDDRISKSFVVEGQRLRHGKWGSKTIWHPGVDYFGIRVGPPVVHSITFDVDIKFPRTGTWRIRVVSRATHEHAASASAWKRTKIR